MQVALLVHGQVIHHVNQWTYCKFAHISRKKNVKLEFLYQMPFVLLAVPVEKIEHLVFINIISIPPFFYFMQIFIFQLKIIFKRVYLGRIIVYKLWFNVPFIFIFMKPEIFWFRHQVWMQPGLHLVQCFYNKPNEFKHIKAISTKTTTSTLLVWSSVAYKMQSNVSGHHVQCYADQMNLSRYCCISRSYKYTGVKDGHCEVWLKPTCSK